MWPLIISILGLCVLVAALIVVVDFWYVLQTWGGRIHIGRWTDRQLWQESLAAVSEKWLRRLPVVPRRDGGRRILWDKLCGMYEDTAIQSWQLAGLAIGLRAFFEKKRDESSCSRIASELQKNSLVRNLVEENSSHRLEADALLLSFALISPEEENDTFPLSRSLALVDDLKTDHGTLVYRRHIRQIRYVDTIGMACPFLAACAVRTGREDIWALLTAQLKEYDVAFLPGSSLPAHAFNLESGYSLGMYGWSRGVGWYVLGVCEAWRLARQAGRPEAEELEKRLMTLARETLPLQKENGGFGWIVTNPESVFESSGTALLGWLMLNAYKVSGEKEFLEAAFRAEHSLMRVTRRDGVLDLCQGDTRGVGMCSDRWGIMPFAQGMALRLSVELDREAE